MKNNGKDSSKKRMSVKTLILLVTSLPLLIACSVITFFSSWIIKDGLESQVFNGLKNAATGALISLDAMSMGSFNVKDGVLYKGDFNVSDNMDFIDYYAESNNVEITFYYGDVRYATTIRDKSGKRLVGTKAPGGIADKVIKGKESCNADNVDISGQKFYGYYMPVGDADGNIVGMAFAGRSSKEITHYIQTRVNFIIFIAIVMYVICIFVSIAVSEKKFIRPIHKLSDVARGLAKGNVNQQLIRESNDEFGDLTDDFISLMVNVKKQAEAAKRMAEGDLTIDYYPVSEQDVMGHAIKTMMDDNNENLGVINDAASKMVAGVQEIAVASNSLAEGSAQQASAVEEITSSIEGIADTAYVNAEDASKANELVKATKDEAVQGNEQMKQLIAAMNDINEASENISKIMKIIDDISFQTNIIALNASVEAARAGVHGKGFAVVAEEVRSLAGKSAEAAKNSAEMIEDAIKKIQVGSNMAKETETALEEIKGSVENVASIISNIAEASASQSTSVSQVKLGITQIADVVQTNSATSEECAAASTELSDLAERLRSAVDKYRLR